MGLAENPISVPEPPQEKPQEPVNNNNSDVETPFTPTDPFWTDTTFHGSDKQLVAGVALHIGHQVAHEAKEGIKSGIKRLLGLW
ncbi:MAG TPA: hypothetical protein VFI61_02040 [Patescibacteria group bacterium]|nr:hypothetical protein [Patescibacteria group bacterium]